MGPGAVIGHLTVTRGGQTVTLGRQCIIGNLNFVNAVSRAKPEFAHLDRHPALIMAEKSRMSTMHFLDASDRIELDEQPSLSGAWSQVMTHTYDFDELRQVTGPIRIGSRSL